MILYDDKFSLLGITKDTLELLGFSSIGLFLSKFTDINDMFMEKKGFVSRDRERFVEFLRSDIDQQSAILMSQNHKTLEILVTKGNFFYTTNSSICTTLTLTYLKEISQDLAINIKKPTKIYSDLNKTNLKIPNVFDLEYKRALYEFNNEIHKKTKNVSDIFQDGNLNLKEWFDLTIKELQISENDLRFFLSEFLKGQLEYEERLQEALLLGDQNTIVAITSLLKDPAMSLNLYPIINYLDKFENSKNSDVSKLFREYKTMLNEIKKYALQRNTL